VGKPSAESIFRQASHRKRRVGGAYQAHVMNQAAAALGRLQEEVPSVFQSTGWKR